MILYRLSQFSLRKLTISREVVYLDPLHIAVLDFRVELELRKACEKFSSPHLVLRITTTLPNTG